MKRIPIRKPPKQILPQQRPKPIYRPLDSPLQIIADSNSDLESLANMDSPKPEDLLISKLIGQLALTQDHMMLPISGFTTQLESDNTSASTEEIETCIVSKAQQRSYALKLVSDIFTTDVEINQLIGRVDGLLILSSILNRRSANFAILPYSTSISVIE